MSKDNEGLNNLGKLLAEDGEVVMEMFGPPNAVTQGADSLSGALYALSETIIRGIKPDSRGGGLGGEFGYGAEYENEVFGMHPSYEQAPHFWHKGSGLKITWYKWIGRDMEVNRDVSGAELATIMRECFESIPADARERAMIEHEHESTPEFKERRDTMRACMLEAMQEMFAAERPCWDCSEAGMFSRTKDGETRGGNFSNGRGGCFAKTLHNEDGACSNCGHVTTPAELEILEGREKANIEGIRMALSH